VIVNGKLSSYAGILSGTPQGSVLGPILFVIFINDLPDVVSSTARIFADDTKLLREIGTIEDHDVLQQDLDNLDNYGPTTFRIWECNLVSKV